MLHVAVIGALVVAVVLQRLQLVATGDRVGWKGAPFAIRALLDLLGSPFLILVVIHLHHVDAGQVLLHLFAIFDAFTVYNVVDVLNLVWAHCGQVLLRRIANT